MKHINYHFTISTYVPENADIKQVFRALNFVADKAAKGFDPANTPRNRQSCASIIKCHNETARRRKNRLALAKQTPHLSRPQDEIESTRGTDATSV